MAVGLGVTVAGEMLGDSHDALALQPFHVLYAQFGHADGVVAERAGTDDGVVGVAVDVHYGGEVDVYAHVAALGTDFAPHVVEQGVHFARQRAPVTVEREGVAVFQPHAETPFSVDAHQQGHGAEALESLDERKGLVSGAHKEAHAAYLGFAQKLFELALFLTLQVQRHTYHHQLRHLLAQGHIFHHRIHPRGGHPGAVFLRYATAWLGFPCRPFHSTHLTLSHGYANQCHNTQQHKTFSHSLQCLYFSAKIHQKSDIFSSPQ